MARVYTRRQVAGEILSSLYRDMRVPIFLLLTTLLIGSVGYYTIFKIHHAVEPKADPRSFLDCIFMTTITLTTIGYGDVVQSSKWYVSEIYTMVLGLVGMGIVLYSLSAVTGVLVKGEIRHIRKRARLMNAIADMDQHIILCGVGTTGSHVARELHRSGARFVMIDPHPILEHDWPEHPVLKEDATQEETLLKAGVKTAKGLIACLSQDRDNVLLALTARILNPDLVIIARGIEAGIPQKLYRAGANYVVVPPEIGGMRIASQMLRPNVVTFLDRMLRAKGEAVRVEEVRVKSGSRIVGKKIVDSRIQEEAGLTVIGLAQPGEDRFIYNPGPHHVLEEDMIILVIGTQEQLSKLAHMAGGGITVRDLRPPPKNT